MTYLVTGAESLLGSNVVATLRHRGEEVVEAYDSDQSGLDSASKTLDIGAAQATASLLNDVAPDVVINCAEMSDLGACEMDIEKATERNAQAPGRLAQLCADRDIAFVHYSSGYVFDGESETRYGEGAQCKPLQVYGETKLEGERLVRENHPSPLVCRASFVWGIHRGTDRLQGFPERVLRHISQGSHVSLSSDRHVSPTRAGNAAVCMVDLLSAGASGTYHIGCRTCLTPFDFGWEIGERVDPETLDLIIQSPAKGVEYPAARPSNTCLDVTKLEDELGRDQPTLETELDEVEPLRIEP